MRFIHKDCGSTVAIDVGDLVKVLANVSCDGNSLRLNSVQLYPISGRPVETKFFCPSCGNIDLDNLIGVCTHGCDKKVEIEKLFLASESGGVYCGNCVKRFEHSEKLIPVSKIINTVRFK